MLTEEVPDHPGRRLPPVRSETAGLRPRLRRNLGALLRSIGLVCLPSGSLDEPGPAHHAGTEREDQPDEGRLLERRPRPIRRDGQVTHSVGDLRDRMGQPGRGRRLHIRRTGGAAMARMSRRVCRASSRPSRSRQMGACPSAVGWSPAGVASDGLWIVVVVCRAVVVVEGLAAAAGANGPKPTPIHPSASANQTGLPRLPPR
jgi:hypothetical protein